MNLTKDDVKRVIWTFLQAAGAVAIAAALDWTGGQVVAWRTVVIAALAAGLSAIKNLLTDPGDTLK